MISPLPFIRLSYLQTLTKVTRQQTHRCLHATSTGNASLVDIRHPKRPASDTDKRFVVHFQNRQGERLATTRAREGENLLDLARQHGIDLEGSCEGQVACSTCHVMLPPEDYRKLPLPGEDENDMLDMVHGLTETSRLGCQVEMGPKVEGLTVTVPSTYGLRAKEA